MLVNGRVLTFNPGRPRAAALAVVGGRIAGPPERGHAQAARAHPPAGRGGHHQSDLASLRSAGDEVARLGCAGDELLPHRSLVSRRIPFGIATDNKPADPWVAFAAVVARRDMRRGNVVGPGEQLTRAQALAALTRGGAWVTFAERERGRLAPGWAADLAVLAHDLLTTPLETLVGQTARLTVVGGDIVHRA